MKKHELIKHAYDNYPKGTRIYSTSGNRTLHETQTPYLIDECGSVQDNYGWLIYYKGIDKWAEIVKDERKPLLTSEDGIPLFENDPHSIVTLCLNGKWSFAGRQNLKASHMVITHPGRAKAFTTNEAAEKWIEEQNKPKATNTSTINAMLTKINVKSCKEAIEELKDNQLFLHGKSENEVAMFNHAVSLVLTTYDIYLKEELK